MTSTATPMATVGVVRSARTRRWSWGQYLALASLPFLVLIAWTYGAWIGDGPRQITAYRDHGSASWYAAHTLEAAVLVVSLLVIVHLVRDCRRQGCLLTFDVMFCLCGLPLFWADALMNGIVPMWLPSSNFVNLNYALGHMPFVVNPDAGRMPDPVLFTIPLLTFGLLGMAMVFGRVVEWMRSRWPGLSTVQLLGLVMLIGMSIDFLIEVCVALPLHLWSWAAPAALTIHVGRGGQIPALEIVGAGLYFGAMMAIRIFKDDRGRSLPERGLDRYSPAVRKGLTLLALSGAFNLVSLVLGNLPTILVPYVSVPAHLPAHIVNGQCDAAGFGGTRYGPCPGAPGFRMPGRTTHLPGRAADG
jgi:hypothetical protein